MDAAYASKSPLSARHALGGLEAGVFGSLLLIACLMLAGTFDGHSSWLVPNLFATTFYGIDAYRNYFFEHSWSGIALIVALYGALGAVWGCVWKDEAPRSLPLIGAAVGIAVYYAFFHLIWNHLNGLIILYAPTRQMAAGHFLWGLALSKSPSYARLIANHSEPKAEVLLPYEK